VTSLNPSNYDREPNGYTGTSRTRYTGECNACSTLIQTTPQLTTGQSNNSHIWARCRDCGAVTRVSKASMEECQ